MNLYSNKDIQLLEDNIENIISGARRNQLKKIEPTLEEYNNVMKIIKNFIIEKKRIIYGGYAYNEVIIKKNPSDRIYSKDMIELPDIEFYSPQPVHDLVELSNIINDKGYKDVNGRSAQHHETYSLFVNHLGYVDISYMPKILYNQLDFLEIDNVRYTHPKFMIIDIMRQYNDPMNSYWRLSKTFKRANILFKHYPIKAIGKLIKHDISDKLKLCLDYVRKNVIAGSNLLVFGYYGYEYYIHKAYNKNDDIYVPYYDVISTNIDNDVQLIYNKLKEFDETIVYEEYHPFFQFLDSHITFKFEGKVVLNVYGSNGMCIPYWNVKAKNINIVTYPYMIMTFLMLYYYYKVVKRKDDSITSHYLLEKLIHARNYYLKNNNKTILDETPFQEFRLNCMGETIPQDRQYRLKISESFKNKKRIPIFRYNPNDKNKKFDPSQKIFDNTSGNINNSKYKIFNI